MLAGGLAAVVSGILPTLTLAQSKGVIAIMTPTPDNPFY